MNARIIAFDHNEILRAQEYVVFFDDLPFLHPARHANALGDGPVLVPASSKITQSLLLMLSG